MAITLHVSSSSTAVAPDPEQVRCDVHLFDSPGFPVLPRVHMNYLVHGDADWASVVPRCPRVGWEAHLKP